MHLLIMACSATKAAIPGPAIDLYRGVMYSTLRVNMPVQPPAILILSARHGLLPPGHVITPYEQLMTDGRADEMVANLPTFDRIAWPPDVHSILLVGGKSYRRVMRAAIERRVHLGSISAQAVVNETTGSIGHQRAQLGAYLRSMKTVDA